MLVYNDVVTGDQVLSDSYAKVDVLDAEGNKIEGLFAIHSKMVGKDGIVLAGANASAEGGDAADDGVEKVNNMIDQEVGFGYLPGPTMKTGAFLKGIFKPWCKAVKTALIAKDIKPKAFMQSAKAALPWLKANFGECEIFFGKGQNPDSFILGCWDDAANTSGAQTFIFFTHALAQEKY